MLRRLAVTALLVPFLLLSLFSNGTMLTRTADERISVVLCIGTEQVEMIWGDDGSLTPASEDPSPSHDDNQTCEWNISAQAAVDVPSTEIPPIRIGFVETRLSIDVPLHMRRINVFAASARGPPRLI